MKSLSFWTKQVVIWWRLESKRTREKRDCKFRALTGWNIERFFKNSSSNDCNWLQSTFLYLKQQCLKERHCWKSCIYTTLCQRSGQISRWIPINFYICTYAIFIFNPEKTCTGYSSWITFQKTIISFCLPLLSKFPFEPKKKSKKKPTKLYRFLPYEEARAEICHKFGWLFGRFEDTKISFWD